MGRNRSRLCGPSVHGPASDKAERRGQPALSCSTGAFSSACRAIQSCVTEGSGAGGPVESPGGHFAAVKDLYVRAARPGDIARIETLVVEMFRDLGTTTVPGAWGAELRQALLARLEHDVGAFLTTDRTGQPIAVAVGVIDQRLPSPRRPAGRIGYVEWLATDARYRRRGAARIALNALLDWFDSHGVDTVDVHASNAAQPLYLDVGFTAPSANPLRRTTWARRSAEC